MIVWGLTGNIACGKSTVERALVAEGVPVIDADRVARQVVEPGCPAHTAIVGRFGVGVLQAGGRLDRARLSEVVFADPEARRALERITHPAIAETIRNELLALEAGGASRAVVSAALMVETGSYRAWHALAVVTCEEHEQVRRLLARDGWTEDEARARMGAQMSQAEKARRATLVLRNDGEESALVDQVRRWVRDPTAWYPSPAV